MSTKLCPKCGEVKGLDAFSRDKCRTDGIDACCKCCRSSARKFRYAKNPEPEKTAAKTYRDSNGEKARTACAVWRKVNPEKSKKWKKENREKVAASFKAWRKANPEKAAAKQKAWRKANPEKTAGYSKSRIASMEASYVAYRLGLAVAQLTPELLELKREHLTIKRLKRELKQAIKSTKETP